MIRTVWLAIACLIALAGLTFVKLGTTSLVLQAASPSGQLAGADDLFDAAVADVLPKGDRLDAAGEDDAIKPVRPVAITSKVASAAPSAATGSEKTWRSSYAKREAGSSRHRNGKVHKASRRNRSYHAARSHGKPKSAMMRRQKKSRSPG